MATEITKKKPANMPEAGIDYASTPYPGSGYYEVPEMASRPVPVGQMPKEYLSGPDFEKGQQFTTPIPGADSKPAADLFAQVQKSKFDFTPANVPNVTDRYEQMYNDARQKLLEADSTAGGSAFADFYGSGAYDTASLKGNLHGGSLARAWMNSPQRSALRQQERSLRDLVKEGTFADNANVKREERQAQAAAAQRYGMEATLAQQQAMNAETERLISQDAYNRGKTRKGSLDPELQKWLSEQIANQYKQGASK